MAVSFSSRSFSYLIDISNIIFNNLQPIFNKKSQLFKCQLYFHYNFKFIIFCKTQTVKYNEDDKINRTTFVKVTLKFSFIRILSR